MKKTADVVIIGAGIQGLSAAYHLNKIGISDVVIVETETIGAGSSGRSAAMLTRMAGSQAMIEIANFGFHEYMSFEEELGTDPEYSRIGLLSLSGDQKVADELRRASTFKQAMGIDSQILTPQEIKQLVPVVNTEDLLTGVLLPEDGIIDPHSIMQGYARNARRLGTTIHEGVKAAGIQSSAGKVSGVMTTTGLIPSGWVVNAAGAQASAVGGWVGVDMPIDNRLRSIFVTQAFPQIPDDTPFVHDDDAEWYYRKEGPGVLMGMGKQKADKPLESANLEFLAKVVEVAMHRVPILAEAEIMTGWTGIRPLTPDDVPIIGPIEGLEGYVNSCGWGGMGVTGAPAGGQLVAEFIYTGQTKSIDLEPFLLSRFT